MLNRLFLWGQQCIEKGAWFFAPLSFAWYIGCICRNFLYDRKVFRVTKVACPVVSIGNIVAGGTGKTPLTVLLASQFHDRRVAILSRGYKTQDEAKLLEKRTHAKVYVGKNRTKLAQKALEEGAEMILLDDGFQHRRLHRDFDLVILHGSDPFGKGHFLPWGFLRDHPRRLKQADAIFVNSAKQKTPYIHLDVQVDPNEIQGKKVAIFCGIAKPHLFRKTVEGMRAHIVDELILADHEKPVHLKSFALDVKKRGAQMLVCTEKDFVKISDEYALPIHCIKISLAVTQGQDQWENLIAKIRQKIDNRTL